MKKLQVEMFCKESSVVVTAWVSIQIPTSGCVNLGKLFDLSVLNGMIIIVPPS